MLLRLGMNRFPVKGNKMKIIAKDRCCQARATIPFVSWLPLPPGSKRVREQINGYHSRKTLDLLLALDPAVPTRRTYNGLDRFKRIAHEIEATTGRAISLIASFVTETGLIECVVPVCCRIELVLVKTSSIA